MMRAALAQGSERIFKQPVHVVHKPGSGSVIGAQFVANSRADSYTMRVAMPSFFISPQVDILFGRPLKFRPEQFTPIARLRATLDRRPTGHLHFAQIRTFLLCSDTETGSSA